MTRAERAQQQRELIIRRARELAAAAPPLTEEQKTALRAIFAGLSTTSAPVVAGAAGPERRADGAVVQPQDTPAA